MSPVAAEQSPWEATGEAEVLCPPDKDKPPLQGLPSPPRVWFTPLHPKKPLGVMHGRQPQGRWLGQWVWPVTSPSPAPSTVGEAQGWAMAWQQLLESW